MARLIDADSFKDYLQDIYCEECKSRNCAACLMGDAIDELEDYAGCEAYTNCPNCGYGLMEE